MFWEIFACVALFAACLVGGGIGKELAEMNATLNQIRWLREP